MSRPSFEHIHMEMAKLIARRSTCARLQVGCVIASADYRKVLSVGYNGNASGLENGCDSTTPGSCGCFVAGTLVHPSSVVRAYKRWYEGPVVRVVTSAVGRYSRMRASANLRNWLAFLTLRMAPGAQWEIRQYANAVAAIVAEKFPRTYELFRAA